MSRILVTGAFGQIGSELVPALQQNTESITSSPSATVTCRLSLRAFWNPRMRWTLIG